MDQIGGTIGRPSQQAACTGRLIPCGDDLALPPWWELGACTLPTVAFDAGRYYIA
jgi:hypothetical protein